MFSRFGAQAAVIEQAKEPLPHEDHELAQALCAQLTAEGIRLEFGAEMRCGEMDARGKRIHIQREAGHAEELLADQRRWPWGGDPRYVSEFKAAGVQTTAEGITTDATLRTNVPHIWAAGDITSPYQFTHVAADQGRLVAHNVFAAEPQAFDDRVIPWVTFTDPELARVGASEADLGREEDRVSRGARGFHELDRAIATNQTVGFVKILADPAGKVLGGHILGANAGDLIAPIVYAMRFGLTVKMMGAAMLPYPTMAEAVRWAADQV